MRYLKGLKILFCAMLLISGKADGQLIASRNSIDLGNLDQRTSDIVEIPVLNQTRSTLKSVSRFDYDDLSTSISKNLATYEEGNISFQLKNRKAKRINETVYIYTNQQDEPLKIKVKAKVVGWKKTKCPEFEDKSIKFKPTQVKSSGAASQAIRIFEKKEKNALFSSDRDKAPFGHIVVLLDASVSMQSNNKLSLMKAQLSDMIRSLRPNDFVSIVLYNHESKILIEKTSCANQKEILEEIQAIKPEGYTNGLAGVESALKIAEENQIPHVRNHIILMTDGEFNFGSDAESVQNFVLKREKEFDFKLSVISISSNSRNAQELKDLSIAGKGHYFKMSDRTISSGKVNKILKIQMT